MTVLAVALLAAGAALIYRNWPEKRVDEEQVVERPTTTAPSAPAAGSGPTAGPTVGLTQNLPTPKHPVEVAGLRMLSLRPNTIAAFRGAPVTQDEPFSPAVRWVSPGAISMIVTAGQAPAGLATDESFLRQAVERDLRGTPIDGQATQWTTLTVPLKNGPSAAAAYAFADAGGQKVLLQYRVFREGDIAWRVLVLAPPSRSEDVDALLETLEVIDATKYDKMPATRPAATRPTTQP